MTKRNSNVVIAENGLLDENVWKQSLKDYPTDLFLKIQMQLQANVKGLSDKFNRNSRYFGYRKSDGSDVLYIHIQKERLRIDLNIDRKHEDTLRRSGFIIKYVNTYQGRAGWLTGWQVPHDTKKIDFIIQWLCKAFE